MITLDQLGYLIGVPLTLMVFSGVLYKENPFFRFVEYTAVGASLAHASVIALEYARSNFVVPIATKGTYYYIIIIIVGLLYLSRHLGPNYRWMVRIPLGFIIGSSLGLGIRASVEVSIVGRTVGTILSLRTGTMTPVDNLILVISCVVVIMYFLMSREQKGPLAYPAVLARKILMLFFGAEIGTRVATMVSWGAARVLYILQSLGLG